MSAMNLVQLLCDWGEDCPTEARQGLNLAGARAAARNEGWHAPGDEDSDEDRCPLHIGMERVDPWPVFTPPYLPEFFVVAKTAPVEGPTPR